MTYVDADKSIFYLGAGGLGAPVIYVVDMVEHPFDLTDLAAERHCNIITVPVSDWNAGLTPWPAPGLYRGEADFAGNAATTLAELTDALLGLEHGAGLSPAKRAICGYSLGGLFALYALTHAQAFDACACLSGSVWYEGWVDYLRQREIAGEGRFAYLSVGTKEKRAAPKLLHGVQRNMEECAEILRERGFEVKYRVGPGNHMAFVHERYEAGLAALEAFFEKG